MAETKNDTQNITRNWQEKQAAEIRLLEIKTVEAGGTPRYRKRANTLYPQPGDWLKLIHQSLQSYNWLYK